MTTTPAPTGSTARSESTAATARGGVHSAAQERYATALQTTANWLLRSAEAGKGGSCAYFGIWGRWAKPYPETTGYIIPTLLDYAGLTGDDRMRNAAVAMGEWLLSIQHPEGYWHGGSHPPRNPAPSVFNTGQILLGMCSLDRATGEERWLNAALAGASWLADGVDDEGHWRAGNYRPGFNPSYYTRVAWPMLEVWKDSGDESVRSAAQRVLDAVVSRRAENGVIRDWGFQPDRAAFTHTIAYTLRGLIESARLLDNWSAYGAPAEAALNHLFRQAELSGGRLPGRYDENWVKDNSFTCLTGCAQVAICLLKLEARNTDLRLVNAACKLVDHVCTAQSLGHPIGGLRGAVGGSRPIWGPYMRFRYPNWAAKFHCDALMLLMSRLSKEGI